MGSQKVEDFGSLIDRHAYICGVVVQKKAITRLGYAAYLHYEEDAFHMYKTSRFDRLIKRRINSFFAII